MLDLTLYLVTSSDHLPAGTTVEQAVGEAIWGGVTIVQLREKELSTERFLKLAQTLRRICQPPVQLIINDRIDIALACDADGVHLGQEDMPIGAARKILGPRAIIGISVNTLAQALAAVDLGASYLGIGTCWPTATKAIPDHKVIGPRGVKAIRDELVRLNKQIPLVVIGGIKSNNLIRTLYGCISSQYYVHRQSESPIGVAVVSAIMSSKEPQAQAQKLRKLIEEFETWLHPWKPNSGAKRESEPDRPRITRESMGVFARKFREDDSPRLIHHITNTVVQNDCANLALAYGCSPIMSSNVNEVEEFVQPAGLVFNLGTFDDHQIQAMKLAGRRANLIGKPVVFDPVGVGATAERKTRAHELLNHVQMSVIKGNQAEVAALARFHSCGISSCGVDAHGQVEAPHELVRKLAQQEHCVVVMTGKTDWISDGWRVYKLENGVKELSSITGSGCMTGTSIACFLASFLHHHVQKDSESGLLTHMQDIHNTGAIIHAAALGISAINIIAERMKSMSTEVGPQALKARTMDCLYREKGSRSFWDSIISELKLSAIDHYTNLDDDGKNQQVR